MALFCCHRRSKTSHGQYRKTLHGASEDVLSRANCRLTTRSFQATTRIKTATSLLMKNRRKSSGASTRNSLTAKGLIELPKTLKREAYQIGTVRQNGMKAVSEKFLLTRNIRAMRSYKKLIRLIFLVRNGQTTTVRCRSIMCRIAMKQ